MLDVSNVENRLLLPNPPTINKIGKLMIISVNPLNKNEYDNRYSPSSTMKYLAKIRNGIKYGST